ncbi:MAG: hypothetical protein CPSOU_4684 [uncultured Paraburkholderia sp.]|nr:MAG: hypothetical protein CPSOU_4684 [uncultured Paraburkholderia sp.]
MKAFLVVCAIALSGCAAGPDFHTLAAPDTQSYTRRPARTYGHIQRPRGRRSNVYHGVASHTDVVA